MSIDFSCRCYGKWILVGEHSVLRGCPALVFPVSSRSLELKYTQNNEPLSVVLLGAGEKVLQDLVLAVIQRACNDLGLPRKMLTGQISLESSIPLGAGMGASAALCVALTRLLGFLGYLSESKYYEFARNLENLFHGESSGVDIAVSLHGQGLRFLRDKGYTPLSPQWKPHWYISYSGKKGVTLDAVNRVKDLLSSQPQLGRELDAQMAQATLIAEHALQVPSELGLPKLAEAINLAGECFEKWGLNEGLPQEHLRWLREQGALAVKPTGSGGGGYVLSLWQLPPRQEVLDVLIPC